MSDLRIRIDAVDLPGLTCPPANSADGSVAAYGNDHVAAQHRGRLDRRNG